MNKNADEIVDGREPTTGPVTVQAGVAPTFVKTIVATIPEVNINNSIVIFGNTGGYNKKEDETKKEKDL